MEFAYRFRPVSRLLSEDGESGELDGLYIFFAAPEQLNDPLEGYKDLFFQGDKIVWGNLIKHYIRCLIEEVFLFLWRDPETPPSKTIGVFASAKDGTDELNRLNAKVYEKLNSEPVIAQYIHCLSMGRKIRRWELINHLTTLHPFVLEEVFSALHEQGLLGVPPSYLTLNRQVRLEHTKKLANLMSSTTEDPTYDLLFKSVHQVSEELKLVSRLNATDAQEKERWFHLIFEFPECYCLSLDKLIFPSWYTACFMASCKDSSIWGTYGGNHRDVCLKFKIDHDKDGHSLNLLAPSGRGVQGVINSSTRMQLHDVSYERDFTEIDFFRNLGQLSIPQLMSTWYMGENGEKSLCAGDIFESERSWRENYWQNFYHAATVKLKAWDREQESRLILSSSINDLSDINLRKLKYNFDSLEGIIFGINTSTHDKIRIIKKIQELCTEFKRKEFSFYQARYDADLRSISYALMRSIKAGYSEEKIAP